MLPFVKTLYKAIDEYQKRNYKLSAQVFEEYFETKINGAVPELDKEDTMMKLNLGNAQLFSNSPNDAINTYLDILDQSPNWDVPYMMLAVAYYKANKTELSKQCWEKSKQLGNPHTQTEYNEGIKKYTQYDK